MRGSIDPRGTTRRPAAAPPLPGVSPVGSPPRTRRPPGRVRPWLLLRPTLLPAAVALVLPVAGCAAGSSDGDAVRRHMFNSMWQMGGIPGRLAVGDLEGVRRPARWLGEQMEADAMLGDATERARLVALAAEVQAAGSVRQAADAVARLAGTCGGCHVEVGAGPLFTDRGDLPVGSRLPTHMLRHIWAADRMWEGLLAADTRHWERGALVLTEDPLAFFERMESNAAVGEYARRIHALGTSALGTQDRHERVRIYAELVSTCAACHSEMGIPRG